MARARGGRDKPLATLLRNSPRIHHYDPVRPESAATLRPAPFVTCIDVQEHAELDLLNNVLDDLQGDGRPWIFTLHTGPVIKVLTDGSNAHLIW